MSKESKEMKKAQKQLEKEKLAWDKKEAKLAKKDKNYVAQPFPGDVVAEEVAAPEEIEAPAAEQNYQIPATEDFKYAAPLQFNTAKGYFTGVTPTGKIKDDGKDMSVYYAALPVSNPVPILTPSPVVQLNPTVFPVSFVPYVTQNQPMLQTIAYEDDANAGYAGYDEGYETYDNQEYGDGQY